MMCINLKQKVCFTNFHLTWEWPEVSVEVLLMITIDGSCHPWPWSSDTVQTRCSWMDELFALYGNKGHFC